MSEADLLNSAVAGAVVVSSGGLYALLLALARLRNSRALGHGAVAAYLVLVVAVLVLADGLDFNRFWYGVVIVMLTGYWLAPRAIWHLNRATHGSTHHDAGPGKALGS